MEKSDKHRAKFYNDFSGRTWGAKENYSLCIDSSTGVENTVSNILEYLESNPDFDLKIAKPQTKPKTKSAKA